MRVRKRSNKIGKSVPAMLAKLTMASWETIARRTMMMAQNRCSKAEYQRMVHEKAQAAMESTMRMALSGGHASLASLLTPWNRRAIANAKRLRKK
jgi:hypothetical protein